MIPIPEVSIVIGRVTLDHFNYISDIVPAIEFEINRQMSLVERNIPIQIEVRHWDRERKITVSTREFLKV